MYDPQNSRRGAVIKVIGIGGGGGNAVRHMMDAGVVGVEFICANTDSQALSVINIPNSIIIGENVTKGLGAGTDPEVGRNAAMESREEIINSLKGAEMVFITTGMGGGTGTGATPLVAQVAREMGILTVGVVTRPFPFEGKRRTKLADEGIRELSQHVDSLITIPNEKLLELLGKDVTLVNAFAKADDVLCDAVRGISNIINIPGMINVDFADIRAVMGQMGMALMGTGQAEGPNRAIEAATMAVSNPLLSDESLKDAKGLLVNITASVDLTLGEYQTVSQIIDDCASEEAIVKVGTVVDDSVGDMLTVTVVATGLDSKRPQVRRDMRSIDQDVSRVNRHTSESAHMHQETHVAQTAQVDSMHQHSRHHQSQQTHHGRQQTHHGQMNTHHGRQQNQHHEAHSGSVDRRDLQQFHGHTGQQHEYPGLEMAAYTGSELSREGSRHAEKNIPDMTRAAAEDNDYLDIPAFLRRS